MVVCGHQFGCSDHSGWLMSSSASAPVGGSSSTAHILHRIMADELYDGPQQMRSSITSTYTEFLQSKRLDLSAAREREAKLSRHREGRVARRRIRVEGYHDFSDFDESEHVEGCPFKWLYRRQSTESWRSTGSKERATHPMCDKIPKEIQIKKIGLKKRKNLKKKKLRNMGNEENKPLTVDQGENIRNGFVTKHHLNNEQETEEEDDEEETDDNEEFIHFQNFLYPRPLTGKKKPWLYVLLAPKFEKPHCSPPQQQKPTPRTDIESDSPRLSVQSISFPDIEISTTKSANLRPWMKKRKTSVKSPHAYRTPALLDITLREKVAKELKVETVEKTETYEEVSNFIEEDRLYRLKRFFNIEPKTVREDFSEEFSEDSVKKNKQSSNIKFKKAQAKESMLLISTKVQFFERPGKPMR